LEGETTGDARPQRRLQRLGRRGAVLERQVVAQHDEALGPVAEQVEQRRQGGDLVAVDLDQLQGREVADDAHEGGLRQGALARAAHAPQQHMI